mmetsp:Transcript_65446/g.182129  ORF Transcript_65446/g.182129 Transcript_65446/m.182129 type:complete len:475 (+) Transcript_65446:151-1575(+)
MRRCHAAPGRGFRSLVALAPLASFDLALARTVSAKAWRFLDVESHTPHVKTSVATSLTSAEEQQQRQGTAEHAAALWLQAGGNSTNSWGRLASRSDMAVTSSGDVRKYVNELDAFTQVAKTWSTVVLATFMLVATLPIGYRQGIKPFATVVVYLVSLVLIKLVVKDAMQGGFTYVYTMTAFHMLLTAFLASIFGRPQKEEAFCALPISLAHGVTVACGNMALLFGSAAFVSMIGACTPVTTFCADIAKNRNATTSRAFAVMVVSLGGLACVQGEGVFSFYAMLFGVVACGCRSVKSVYQQELLQHAMEPCKVAAWTGIWCFIWLIPIVAYMEGLSAFRALPLLTTHTKLATFVGSVLAASLNISQVFAVKYLGSVLQTTMGQLQLIMVIVLATAWLNEVVSKEQWVGVALICGGCVLTKISPQRSFADASKSSTQSHAELEDEGSGAPEDLAPAPEVEQREGGGTAQQVPGSAC